MDMDVHNVGGFGYDSNVYLIKCSKPILVDTGTGQGIYFKKMIENIEKLCSLKSIKTIVLTHMHFDHTGGTGKLQKLTDANLLIHEDDAGHVRIGDNVATGARMFGGSMEPLNASVIGECIDGGDIKLKVIHTPGHSPGSVSLYEPESKSLFSGDTVFADGSTGRWDLIGGNYSQLLNSVRKLSKLDVKNLYPGHERFVEGNGNEHIMMALRFIESIE
ncbi:MAG: MBL fold metallo-hydrolase [Candidatus Thermoplasmatota archaeon]|nr:MBL fold metallo-hydrolase [Candidatus Thermoplasmatota archaeon]